jgi:hypothetical protein
MVAAHPDAPEPRVPPSNVVAERMAARLEQPFDPANPSPIPMLLWCPAPGCNTRHVDKGEFATKHHHTHACQACGMVWRPAIVPTVGVQFLPGFKDDPT